MVPVAVRPQWVHFYDGEHLHAWQVILPDEKLTERIITAVHDALGRWVSAGKLDRWAASVKETPAHVREKTRRLL